MRLGRGGFGEDETIQLSQQRPNRLLFLLLHRTAYTSVYFDDFPLFFTFCKRAM
jgi:hypothetical protein